MWYVGNDTLYCHSIQLPVTPFFPSKSHITIQNTQEITLTQNGNKNVINLNSKPIPFRVRVLSEMQSLKFKIDSKLANIVL